MNVFQHLFLKRILYRRHSWTKRRVFFKSPNQQHLHFEIATSLPVALKVFPAAENFPLA
jgi:hypothetical protein